MLKNTWNVTPPSWVMSSLTSRKNLNLQRRNSEPAALGGRCVVAVARITSSVGRRWPISSQQLECDWLAPCRWVRFNQTLFFTFLLFCETHDLVWEIISVSEKRMKKLYYENYWQCFRKNDEGGLFPLSACTRKWIDVKYGEQKRDRRNNALTKLNAGEKWQEKNEWLKNCKDEKMPNRKN